MARGVGQGARRSGRRHRRRGDAAGLSLDRRPRRQPGPAEDVEQPVERCLVEALDVPGEAVGKLGRLGAEALGKLDDDAEDRPASRSSSSASSQMMLRWPMIRRRGPSSAGRACRARAPTDRPATRRLPPPSPSWSCRAPDGDAAGRRNGVILHPLARVPTFGNRSPVISSGGCAVDVERAAAAMHRSGVLVAEHQGAEFRQAQPYRHDAPEHASRRSCRPGSRRPAGPCR